MRWSAVAVSRILSNECYTGTLVQGKSSTPNYKVKKAVVKDKADWVRIEDAFEAIIPRAEFDLVQGLLLRGSLGRRRSGLPGGRGSGMSGLRGL